MSTYDTIVNGTYKPLKNSGKNNNTYNSIINGTYNISKKNVDTNSNKESFIDNVKNTITNTIGNYSFNNQLTNKNSDNNITTVQNYSKNFLENLKKQNPNDSVIDKMIQQEKIKETKKESYINNKLKNEKSNFLSSPYQPKYQNEISPFEVLEMSKEFDRIYNSKEYDEAREEFQRKYLRNYDINDVFSVDYSKLPKAFAEQITEAAVPIGKTAINTATNIAEGALRGGEGILDATMYFGGNALNWGANKLGIISDQDYEIYKNAINNMIKDDLTNKAKTNISKNLGLSKEGWTDETTQIVEKNSLIKRDNLLGQTFQAVGQMYPTLLLGNSKLGKLGATATTGASSFGSALQEAYQDGANDEDAFWYAIGSTATEIGTEWLTNGIPGLGGKGGLDFLVDKNIEKISNQLVKELTRVGYKMVGEGAEEALSEIISPLLKNATYSEGEQIDWSGVLTSAIVGGLASGVLDAPYNIYNISNAINNNAQSIGNTSNANNSLINDSINQNEKNINKNIQNPLSSEMIGKSKIISYLPSGNNKVDALYQSATNSNMNNTKVTKDLLNIYSKINKDKDYNVVFDNTITNKNGQSVNAQINTNKNGEIEIKINPNSPRAGEFLLVHEITHAIETDTMKQLVMDYANQNSEFNQSLESLKQIYETEDVSSEVLADISGQLLGNQEFIDSLTKQNTVQAKNIIRQIYEGIKRVLNNLTKEGRYRNFAQDLETKWRDAYRNTTTEQAINNLNDETKYAKQFQDILLKNQNLNSNSRIPIVYSNEKIDTTSQNSMRLQNDFKNNVKNGDYENKATGYIASITSETKGKILRPNGANTATKTQNYILRMISSNNLPTLFENAVYIDTLPPMKGKSNNTNELGYHHFVAPINIEGTIYRVLISGKEKQNSKKLYSLNIEILPQKNGNVPLANTNSGYQSSGTLPSDISISDLVKNVNVYNYDTGQYQIYNDTDIKYSMQESQSNALYRGEHQPDKTVIGDNLTSDGIIDDINEFRYFPNGNIKNSISNQTWQEHLEKNYKATGTRTNFKDIRIETSNEVFDSINKKKSNEKLNNDDRLFSLQSKDNNVLVKEKIENELIYTRNKAIDLYNELSRLKKGVKASEELASILDLGYSWYELKQALLNIKSNPMKVVNKNSTVEANLREMIGRDYEEKLEDYIYSDLNEKNTKTDIIEEKSKKTEDISKKMDIFSKTEEKIKLKKTEKFEKKYNIEKKKNIKKITKEASKILEFSDYKTKNKFQEELSSIYDNPSMTEIKELLKDNFSEQRIEYVNDEIKSIKKEIRATDLKVPDYVKKSIADYSDFRKKNFNRLRLKNEGQTIDSFYNELSDMYPSIFDKNISNEIDQLIRLSDFMDEDSSVIEKYKLDNKAINEASEYIFESLINKKNINELINEINISPKEIRKEKTVEYREQAKIFVKNSNTWVDKKLGLNYKINTMERNFYDIMPKQDAKNIYENYIEPIFVHNAEMQKEINIYNEKIKKLNLNENESIAVQMLGEYKYNKDSLLTGEKVNSFINENKLDYEKITKSVEVFREVYEELLPRINKVLKEQGFNEIEHRQGYFPHFVEEHAESKIGKIFEKLGFKFKNNEIPTSIAGITDTFKPGKVWTSFSQQRKGKITDYNALKGMDNYIRGAMEIIYFTEDIQKLRALENEIRYIHSDKGIQNQIDEINDDNSLNFDEKQEKFEKIFSTYTTPLNNFVTELRDYTNSIANKKSGLDRTIEQLTSRKIYGTMQNISNRLSANMVGLNLSSAITNFIPLTQAAGEVKSKFLLKGIKESIKNQINDDGFELKSVFLTTRLKSAEPLYKTKLDSVSKKVNFMFEGIDSITSNAIVRGKYYQNISKGMSEFEAMRNADNFARKLMAGRSKGEMPTAFNTKNPLLKIFTAFQLEVNNQYGYLFKDLPRDIGEEAKKKIAMALFKIFAGAWIYNQITDKIVGRKSAFSPIDTADEIFSIVNNKKIKNIEKSSKVLENVSQNIPFIGGLLGGGRLPISSVANPISILKGESSISDETKKLLYYTLLPFGGGQLKKSVEGATMYTHDIPGSYTKSGKLRFEANKSVLGVIQNILFGQYSSKEAREYFDNEYLPLSANQQEEIKKMGISVSKYRKFRNDYEKLNEIKSDDNVSGTAAGKKAYQIINSDYSFVEKEYLLSKISNSSEAPTIQELKKLDKNEEIYKFYYSMNSDGRSEFQNEMDKYKFSSQQLYDYYTNRKKYNDKNIYTSLEKKNYLMEYLINSNLNDNQKIYLYSKDYGGEKLEILYSNFHFYANDYLNTMNYVSSIKESYSGSNYSEYRKSKIFQYINGLNEPITNKILLFKLSGYSINEYKSNMYQFIENLKITKDEKEEIWNYLY